MLFNKLIYFITINALFYAPAHAEYRAYELAVQNVETGQEKMTISTLDHLQYPGYYPLRKGEIVVYRSSWMCWGNSSDFQPICPKPTDSAPARLPANSPPAP